MILSMGGEELMRRRLPRIYDALHAAQPMVMTNTAILGAVLLASQENLTAPQAMLFGIFGALGFLLAALLFIGCASASTWPTARELPGVPHRADYAGLLSMAFMGFTGLACGEAEETVYGRRKKGGGT
jgi:electron transport complex protein RnfA